jgi:molybdopterin molybdotransferase
MSNPLHRRKNDDISNRGPKDMLGRTGIVPLAEAQEILRLRLSSIVCGEEEVGLEDGLGRITSRDLYSPEDLPPHPRATMDGYAVRAADTFGATESMPVYLEISGEVRMGGCGADA